MIVKLNRARLLQLEAYPTPFSLKAVRSEKDAASDMAKLMTANRCGFADAKESLEEALTTNVNINGTICSAGRLEWAKYLSSHQRCRWRSSRRSDDRLR
jgi:hypothetical protein